MQVLVLWEHGFIDKLRLKSYTLNESPDAIRFDQKEFSLKLLMGHCLDFEEEETQLLILALLVLLVLSLITGYGTAPGMHIDNNCQNMLTL